MGSIYYRAERKRWRVQIRYFGKRIISAHFATYEEAKKYHDEANTKVKAKEDRVRAKNALDSVLKQDS